MRGLRPDTTQQGRTRQDAQSVGQNRPRTADAGRAKTYRGGKLVLICCRPSPHRMGPKEQVCRREPTCKTND
jgi:hypothetical protein